MFGSGIRSHRSSTVGKRYTSDEIARAWARQESEDGRCPSAMSFRGKKFYSYSTCIAEITEHNGESIFWVSADHYSNTTAGHLGCVRSAIGGGYPWHNPEARGRGGKRIFIVPGVSMGSSNLADFRRILNSWQIDAEYKLEQSEGTSHKGKRSRLITEAYALTVKMRAFAEFFGLSLDQYAVDPLPAAEKVLPEWQQAATKILASIKTAHPEFHTAIVIKAYAIYVTMVALAEGLNISMDAYPVLFPMKEKDIRAAIKGRQQTSKIRARLVAAAA